MGRRLGVSEDWLATGLDRDLLAEDRTLLDAEIALRFSEFDTAEELYTQALDAAATNNERARSLAGLGQIAFERGEPRRAVQSLEQALSLSGAEASDQPSLADTLGRAYAMLDDVEPAIRLFRQSLDRASERKNTPEAIRFGVLLANAYIDIGEFDEAGTVLRRRWRRLRTRAIRSSAPGSTGRCPACMRCSGRSLRRRATLGRLSSSSSSPSTRRTQPGPTSSCPRGARPRKRGRRARDPRPWASARRARWKPGREGVVRAREGESPRPTRPRGGGGAARRGERRGARGREPGRCGPRPHRRRRGLRAARRHGSGDRDVRACRGAAVGQPESLCPGGVREARRPPRSRGPQGRRPRRAQEAVTAQGRAGSPQH